MRKAPGQKVTSDFLSARLEALGAGVDTPVAVAVSGGSDSMALLHLAAQCRPVLALTVDHGLRPGSSAEAQDVAKFCEAHGISHQTLLWSGEKPSANLQAEARAARYRLLDAAATSAGIDCLLTAHHLDDQAETFLLRLARGSGVYGLASMEYVRQRGLIRHLRPFLDIRREDLRAVLHDAGIGWSEDPSNIDPRHQRVRVRKLLEATDIDGLTAERLAATSERMRRVREALETMVIRALKAHVHIDRWGSFHCGKALIGAWPKEIVLRALATLIQSATGSAYMPREEHLLSLYEALATNPFKGATMGGARFVPLPDGFSVVREASAVPVISVQAGESVTFDSRLHVTIPFEIEGDFALAALDDQSWGRLKPETDAEKVPPLAPARAAWPVLLVNGVPRMVPDAIYAPSRPLYL